MKRAAILPACNTNKTLRKKTILHRRIRIDDRLVSPAIELTAPKSWLLISIPANRPENREQNDTSPGLRGTKCGNKSGLPPTARFKARIRRPESEISHRIADIDPSLGLGGK